jgi:hypothetical protein
MLETIVKSYITVLPFGNLSDHFTDQGGLNKDPTVRLDGARPANTCISSSFTGT